MMFNVNDQPKHSAGIAKILIFNRKYFPKVLRTKKYIEISMFIASKTPESHFPPSRRWRRWRRTFSFCAASNPKTFYLDRSACNSRSLPERNPLNLGFALH